MVYEICFAVPKESCASLRPCRFYYSKLVVALLELMAGWEVALRGTSLTIERERAERTCRAEERILFLAA